MAWATALASARRRLARIRVRLLLVLVLVGAVPIVGISFAHRHESQLLAALEHDLAHQAAVVRAAIAADPAGPALATRGELVAAIGRQTGAHLGLVDDRGVVVADSRPGAPSRVGDRREIRAALAGRYGAATRLQDDHRVYLFVALPVMHGGRTVGAIYAARSTRDVKVQLFELRAWLGKLLAATIVATALLAIVLAWTIARPLARLTERARRIAAHQPVTPDRLVDRADEIGELARAVAAMTDELERRARDARSLAADISHEFKTPLTGIRGAAELLRDDGIDAAQRERFLAIILDDAARLDRLVSRLLELARIEDDRGGVVPVDVGRLARAAAARVRSVAVDVRGGAIGFGRAPAIASAIENLIANASQHAEPGSTVRVAVGRRGDRARVAVANVGPALSEVAQRRVWDRFYTTRVAAGGSGLGLAIVRSVATAHRGGYGVDCADGVTTFWFEVTATAGAGA